MLYTVRLDGEEITCQRFAGTLIATLHANDGFKLIAMLFTHVVCHKVLKKILFSTSGSGGNDASCKGVFFFSLFFFLSTLSPNARTRNFLLKEYFIYSPSNYSISFQILSLLCSLQKNSSMQVLNDMKVNK